MWQTKRKNKKELVRLKKQYVFIFLIVTVLIFISYYLFRNLFFIFTRPIYISPVPISINKDEKNRKEEKINGQIETVKELFAKNNLPIVSTSDAFDRYLIYLESGEEITLSKEKSLESQISSLQLILSRLTIEGKRLNKADFRFDKPVVLFR